MDGVGEYTTGMIRGLKRIAIAAALAWGCTIAVSPARAPADSRADSVRRAGAMATPAGTERLTGTVFAVDTGARTFDLVTGVGYALRVRRIHLPPERNADVRHAATAQPQPGSVVRVELRQTARGAFASTVEVIQIPPREETP
jgi:hypothetical protein